MANLQKFQGLVRKSLHHEVVVDALRELILDGELEPTSRVNELALCEQFGISRTPLREAIKLLAAEGLLELLPNRGARVVAIAEAEIADILQVVGALEGAAGELACERITAEEFVSVETMTTAMVAAWKAGDYPTYFKLNREIHDAIIAAARNTALQSTYRSLSGRVQRARFSARKTDEQWARAIEDHQLMVIFLRRKDAAALGQLMREHIRSKRPVITAAYSEADNAKPREGKRRANIPLADD